VSEATEQITNEVQEVSVKFDALLEWIEGQKSNMIGYVFNIILALVIFAIGKKLIGLVAKILAKTFNKSNMDEGVCRFLLSIIKIVLYVLLIVIIAGFLGIETTSLAAIIGSAGLAIGLSLQGSLSNFAGGVLILILKPFVIGDYIVTEGVEGTVTHIDIFYTRLNTPDNKLIVIPNGRLSNDVITNATKEEIRRVDITVGIEYNEEYEKVKRILEKIANREELVLKDQPVTIYIDSFSSSSVDIGFRVWANTSDYWQVKWNMLETIKREFDANGISIPFDQLDVNVSMNNGGKE